MTNKLLSLFSLLVFFFSCQTNGGDQFEAKDLLEYGVPITIMVPSLDSVIIDKDDLGPIEDVTVDGGEGYFIQIYSSATETNDISKLKAEQLNLVKEQPYFSRVITEEEAGFTFENTIDSTNNYGFRYIYIKGDREYVFQNHLSRLFSLEQVEQMYKAVKPRE